jgi:hypothetical protein
LAVVGHQFPQQKALFLQEMSEETVFFTQLLLLVGAVVGLPQREGTLRVVVVARVVGQVL